MLKDSDTKRLEIRKGKFLFKLAVRGNAKTLSKFLQHGDEEKLPEGQPESLEGHTVTENNSNGDSNSKENCSDYDACVFPPIQVCRTHQGNWKSSTNWHFNNNVNGKSADSEGKQGEGFTVEGGKATENDGREKQSDSVSNHVTNVINNEHFEKVEYEETKIETDYSSANVCRMEYLNSNVVTLKNNNTLEEAEVAIETNEFDPPYNYVISEDEDHEETHCEYDYILDSDNSRCQTPVDICNTAESVNKQYISEYKNANEYNNCSNTRNGPHDDQGRVCDVEGSVKETETQNDVLNNISPALKDINIHNIGMIEDEGEATETEFEPLEGDEWGEMETVNHSNVTSAIGEKDAEGGVTDEENSSSDFEDLISQYVTYMPREISRAVNIKRRAAHVTPTSATYRRCSSELKRYFCEKCGRSYKSSTDYRTHKETHKTNECKICFKEFQNIKNLLRHSNIHLGDDLSTCLFCKNTFSRRESLYIHVQKHHLSHMSYENIVDMLSAKSEKSYSFKLKKSSNINLSANDKKRGDRMTNGYRETKDQTCSIPESLKETKLKECHVCIKKFEPWILERHMRAHTGERPYACDRCSFRCSQLGNLNKHKSVVHLKKDNSDKRILKFKCDTCNKRFYDNAHLRRHALTHFEKSVKHYSCIVCKKTFRFSSGLHRHMQLHKDGLKICCGICNRRFYDSSALNKHLERHTSKI
jgi:KRAB domain-containing zinc finger protein